MKIKIMIYANKAVASERAAYLNANCPGHGQRRAARIAEGWTIRVFSPYSNGDVLEWAGVSICAHCGALKEEGRSCGCFDNYCQ